MMIPINDLYRIKGDSLQWMIQGKRIRKGKDEWESRLFFPTLQGALKELGEKMVRESKVDTLVDALETVEKVTTTLSQALTPQLEKILEVQPQGEKDEPA